MVGIVGGGIVQGATSSGLVSDSVPTYADLPSAIINSGKLYYVETGTVGALGMYLYPKGLYFASSGTWIQSRIQVNISQDSNSLVNLTNWTNVVSSGQSYNIGDLIIFLGIHYTNITGIFTSTIPSLDTINWRRVKVLALDVNIDDIENYYNSTEVENALQEIGEVSFSTGWDRENFESFPIIEFCELASSGTYRRIDRLGAHTDHSVETTFGDGTTPLADRTWCIRPDTAGGFSSFYYWFKGKKYTHTTSQTKQSTLTEGRAVCVFQEGNITLATSIHEAIVHSVIVSIVYSDGLGNYPLFADERHGREKAGISHEYEHLTTGCRYEKGIDILGLVDAQETYSSTGSGVAWDEDLQMYPTLQTTHPFLYREGVDGHWVWTTPDNRVAYSPSRDNTTNTMWNEWTGTTWQLSTSGPTTDYIIMHFLLTNDSKYPVVKIIGQGAYGSRLDARNAIEKEIYNLETGGLPSPELVFLYSIIVRKDTTLEDLSDGSTYVDFRTTTSAGAGGASGSVVYHNDLLGRTLADAHPISAITGLQNELDKPLSAGVLGTVPALTDNGDGSVNLASCEVGLFDNNSYSGTISKYNILALSNIILTDLQTNYIIVNYNSGVPVYQVTTDVSIINESDIIPIYTIYRNGLGLSYINWDSLGQGLSNKLNARFVKTQRFGYESGFTLSEKNTRELLISEGVTWHGAVRNPLSSVDSLTNQMNFWYPVSGVWTNSIETSYRNTQYSNGTDLQNLLPNKYTTVDVYRTEMNTEKMAYVLGNTYGSKSEASNAPLANIPPQVSTLGFIVGRLIIINGGAIAIELQGAFEHTFASVPITEHNGLSGLNDGDYKHLTAAEYANLGIVSHNTTLTGDGTTGNALAVNPALSINQLATIKQSFTPTGTTQTIDWALGSYVELDTSSATGSITLTLNNARESESYLIEVSQGATPRDIIFPAGTLSSVGGITITGEANSIQSLSVYFNGTNYRVFATTVS